MKVEKRDGRGGAGEGATREENIPTYQRGYGKIEKPGE